MQLVSQNRLEQGRRGQVRERGMEEEGRGDEERKGEKSGRGEIIQVLLNGTHTLG